MHTFRCQASLLNAPCSQAPLSASGVPIQCLAFSVCTVCRAFSNDIEHPSADENRKMICIWNLRLRRLPCIYFLRPLAQDARTVRPTRCVSRCSPFSDNIALMPYFVLILLLFVAPVCVVKRKRDGVQFCNFHGKRHFSVQWHYGSGTDAFVWCHQ